MMLNESNVTHFLGAFAFGVFAKQILPPGGAFLFVCFGALLLELWQYQRAGIVDRWYWLDTGMDVALSVIGAALACFRGWC